MTHSLIPFCHNIMTTNVVGRPCSPTVRWFSLGASTSRDVLSAILSNIGLHQSPYYLTQHALPCCSATALTRPGTGEGERLSGHTTYRNNSILLVQIFGFALSLFSLTGFFLRVQIKPPLKERQQYLCKLLF